MEGKRRPEDCRVLEERVKGEPSLGELVVISESWGVLALSEGASSRSSEVGLSFSQRTGLGG